MKTIIKDNKLEDQLLNEVSGGSQSDSGNPENGKLYQCLSCKTVYKASPGTVNSCPVCRSSAIDTEYGEY